MIKSDRRPRWVVHGLGSSEDHELCMCATRRAALEGHPLPRDRAPRRGRNGGNLRSVRPRNERDHRGEASARRARAAGRHGRSHAGGRRGARAARASEHRRRPWARHDLRRAGVRRDGAHRRHHVAQGAAATGRAARHRSDPLHEAATFGTSSRARRRYRPPRHQAGKPDAVPAQGRPA